MDRKRPCSDCRAGTIERRAGSRGIWNIQSTDTRAHRVAGRVLYRSGDRGSARGGSDCSEGDVYSTGRGRFAVPGGTDSDPGGGQRAEADTHHGAGEREL